MKRHENANECNPKRSNIKKDRSEHAASLSFKECIYYEGIQYFK